MAAGIVAVTRFCEAGSAAFSSYIDYIDRESAVITDNLSKFNLFDDYMDNNDKTNTEKVSALFTKDYDKIIDENKAGIKAAFQRAQDNGSNMWQTVISFDNAYLKRLGIMDQDGQINEKQMRSAARASVEAMLSREGLENGLWCASFHYNTDNLHIHIATVEPVPMREKKTYKEWLKDDAGKFVKDEAGKKIPVLDRAGNQKTYTAYKGVFKQTSIEELKSTMRSELEQNQETYKDITQMLRQIVSNKKDIRLMDDDKFTVKMQSLYTQIKENGTPRRYWNYNQNTLHVIKAQIDDLSEFYIQTYHKDDYIEMMDKMEKEAHKQSEAYGGDVNDYIQNQLYGKTGGLYTRLGNAILKELKDYDKGEMAKGKAASDIVKQYFTPGKNYNPQMGIDKLNELAEKGNCYASNKLGFLYLKGEHVTRNTEKARQYFEKSAAQGNALGKKMSENINSKGVSDNPISNGRDFRIAARHLRRSLNHNFQHFKNLQEAEKLQEEIASRGEDI